MKRKKVSAEQIDQLFEFVETRGMKFYDLQLELVDHFASAIEKEWEQNPEKDFTVLMTGIYRDFDDHHFKKLQQQKLRALALRSWKMTGSFFVSFFSWPRVLLTVLSIVLLHQVLSQLPLEMLAFKWFGITTLLLTIGVGIYFYFRRPKGKQFIVFYQTLILLMAGISFGNLIFLQIPSWFNISESGLEGWQLWAASIYLIGWFLIYIGFFFYSRIQLWQEMEKAFPKYAR